MVRHSQGMGNGKRYKRLANALLHATFAEIKVTLPKLVDICTQVENDMQTFRFVTNACKYSASVANFEKMSNIFIHKHIRKHIRICVRTVLYTNSAFLSTLFFFLFNYVFFSPPFNFN